MTVAKNIIIVSVFLFAGRPSSEKIDQLPVILPTIYNYKIIIKCILWCCYYDNKR